MSLLKVAPLPLEHDSVKQRPRMTLDVAEEHGDFSFNPRRISDLGCRAKSAVRITGSRFAITQQTIGVRMVLVPLFRSVRTASGGAPLFAWNYLPRDTG